MYARDDMMKLIFPYHFIISDLGSLLPAWALFLTNSVLRKSIYKTVNTNFIISIRTNIGFLSTTIRMPDAH